MTVVVVGIDALDPDLVDPESHPNLTLDAYGAIDTIVSSTGEPSTHELWPTIITGLQPDEHGLTIDDGVAWENPLFAYGSRIADFVLPATLQTKLGAWLLDNTSEDAFRVPATYYARNDIETLFDGRESEAIGIPNYVTEPNEEDREHQLRRDMGCLFERDLDAKGGHQSADPVEFYELCMEMSMVRIALVRRALRSREYELVFGYTSGLDLIGHVSYDVPALQESAYDELDNFVGEVRSDLGSGDELVLISDHGLQDGVHTAEAMIAGTSDQLVENVDSVANFRPVIERELDRADHRPQAPEYHLDETRDHKRVVNHLENLGYL